MTVTIYDVGVSFYNITKGKFKLASQIVKVGDNGMHVFVNDWDINNWNMFMYVGNWQPKLRGHHFKGNIYLKVPWTTVVRLGPSRTVHTILFSVKNTVQVQGGLMNLFSGQSALQHEFGYNLGRFMSKLETFCEVRNNGFRFGNNSRIIHRNTNTSIQRCLESTNGAFRFGFITILRSVDPWMRVNKPSYKTKKDADPYLTLKSHNTIYQDDKSFDCDNLFSLSWQRQVRPDMGRPNSGHEITKICFRGKQLDSK